ncbi:MAG TPA: 4Fe-4S dicluster domain-containing protein [Tepidisphaeraceae bacterium]|nr:4Fe-4S dicluster domain-containing protein [Tepidisphaeraceae bacterium]
MSDDRPLDRRRFFVRGFRELMKPLAQAVEPVERALRELDVLDRGVAPGAAGAKPWTGPPVYLRPPGALSEREFRDTCSRCGTCAAVCPAQAIKIDTAGVHGHGAPYIVAADSPCVACDGLHCMQSCPSGALVRTPLFEIDMGTAAWHEDRCVRSRGEDCQICVDQCPLGTAALTLDGPRVKVIEEGCIGCGVCERYCPTSPKSIVVIPKAQRDSGTVARR